MSFLSSIFRRPDYQSETTQFLEQLKSARPGLQADQQAGRLLLWDKRIDRDAWREFKDATVRQKPYVYQTDAR